MAEKKSVATTTRASDSDEPQTKAALQQRMDEARESLAQTVEEIKETVTDQYEAVKETVTDVLDWREQFKENPLVWGVGAVAAGLVIGYSIALARQDEHPKRGKRSASSSDSVANTLFDEISVVGQTILLPAINGKVKELFGIDLSAHLFAQPHTPHATRRSIAKKSVARKKASKKAAKQSARKTGAKKSKAS
jgi:ElaB/YqjD/DUF883 family membrane-anchored ribosome-binding protein